MFQYPLADRVGFWGTLAHAILSFILDVSVSSCGSSWFLGDRHFTSQRRNCEFQYPLADRVGFWGRVVYASALHRSRGFSILLRIELVFGAY
mgnify:CR=1 FL=1